MDAIRRDLRTALRSIVASPAFALTVVLSLGVGIGATTTVFAWLDNIVRRPFPVIPDGAHLVALNVADGAGAVEGMPPVAYPLLQEWLARVTGFDSVAAHAPARMNLRSTPAAAGDPIWTEIVSASFFDVLRIQPSAGRFFGAGDDRERPMVVVVSHGLWQRTFGGARDLIGRTVILNGVPLTVIGIAPPRFGGVVTGLAFDAWVPLWMQPTLAPGSDWERDRGARRMQAVGRIRAATSLSVARRDLHAAAREVSASLGDAPLTGAAARWVSDTQLGSLIGPLGAAMLALAAIVLGAACANIAGLMLARGVNRQQQTAIQIALGASRRELVRQGLVQAGVLALLGFGVGLWIARGAKNALLRFVPRVALPVNLEIDLNWSVVAFAALVTLAALLVSALLPALRASQVDVVDALKGSASAAPRRRSLRHALVVAQVMCSLTALASASLFLRSVAAAGHVPLGFGDPNRVLLVATDLSFMRLEGAGLEAEVDEALEKVRALPGVAGAALASFVPLSFGGPPAIATRIEGYPPQPQEQMFIDRAVVTDGYFEAMGIPIVAGRVVTAFDRPASIRVAVVNHAFAARYYPQHGAVGRRIDQGDGWATIVGVVRNSAVGSLTEAPRPVVYHAWAQRPVNALTLHLRSRGGDPLALVEPVRHALRSVHADLPALDPRTLADHMQAATFVQSLGAGAFSVFGVIAALIATIGLYGMMAQQIAERRRDLAIAVALGASYRTVAAMLAWPVVRLAAVGIGLGTALSIVIAASARHQLIGVAPVDPVTLLGSTAVIALTVLVSCARPIWRAATADPTIVVRT